MAVLGVIGIIILLVACSALQTWVHYAIKDDDYLDRKTKKYYEKQFEAYHGKPYPKRRYF